MPDLIEPPVAPTPPPAAPAPPSSATAGTPVPESTTGSASLVDQMEALIAAPAKPAEPEKKAPERGEDGKFKPVAEPVKAKAEPAKTDKPDPAKEHVKDPVALRKRLAEVEGQLKQTQTEKQTELTKLNEKLAALEKRRYLTPEDEQRVTTMENRAKELEADLIARDFRQSPEFKREYHEKWQKNWNTAVEDVTSLQITDATSGENRVATAQDFEKIRLAGNRAQQRIMARSLFPEDADLVLGHLQTLKGIEEQAADAVARKQASFESEQKEQSQTYQTKYQEVDANLVQKYPNYFGDDPVMPEASAEMQKGLDYVDKAMAAASTAPVPERAALAATLRRWAGSFPRMVFTLGKKDAEITELKERLAKYEASDPGSGGDAPPPSNVPKNTGGVDALADEIEKQIYG